MLPRVFTTADGLLPVDLAHCGLDHLTSAQRLFNSGPSHYDSAGYLAHIGIELLFKGWLLESTGRFEGIHNLGTLHGQLVSFAAAPTLDDQSSNVLVLLDQYESLRYPNRKNPIEV
ncbi:MAG: HEPN domain-containing protein [Gammaproteobacteria bacterium]|nr:HEPN domain-containing protein [Gammaproteobacteria bacterium]MBU1775521.1 HEPN domain-containing protein [Gammaproteobacteria bacterium]MBU1969514.1 HEPN domain-containing protein [Gammaproteobacteria bacterium]